jgi:LmbE family N-acetylglucosaminyl deacetylase
MITAPSGPLARPTPHRRPARGHTDHDPGATSRGAPERTVVRTVPRRRCRARPGCTVEAIQDATDAVRPTVIDTHSLHDNDEDHRACHGATIVVGRQVPEIHCYPSPSTAVSFAPSRVVDITGVIERKLDALRAFHREWTTRDSLDENLIRSTARYWRRFGGGTYAEALETVRAQGGFSGAGSSGLGRPDARDTNQHLINGS